MSDKEALQKRFHDLIHIDSGVRTRAALDIVSIVRRSEPAGALIESVARRIAHRLLQARASRCNTP